MAQLEALDAPRPHWETLPPTQALPRPACPGSHAFWRNRSLAALRRLSPGPPLTLVHGVLWQLAELAAGHACVGP